MNVTAYSIAKSFLGVHEKAGPDDHPLIRYCHSLTAGGEAPDEVAWCSSFAQLPAKILNLSRSYSKSARSWLRVGRIVTVDEALAEAFDVVIFKRGNGPQPGPEVIAAPGHVAFYGGRVGAFVLGLGGNQGDEISIRRFPLEDVLGIRRLWELA